MNIKTPNVGEKEGGYKVKKREAEETYKYPDWLVNLFAIDCSHRIMCVCERGEKRSVRQREWSKRDNDYIVFCRNVLYHYIKHSNNEFFFKCKIWSFLLNLRFFYLLMHYHTMKKKVWPDIRHKHHNNINHCINNSTDLAQNKKKSLKKTEQITEQQT